MSRQEGLHKPNYGPDEIVSPPTSPLPGHRYPNYSGDGNGNGNQGFYPYGAAVGSGGNQAPIYTQGAVGSDGNAGAFAPVYPPEKNSRGGPPGYGAYTYDGNMPVSGQPPESRKTILGLRRRTFYIIVGVVVLLLLAGLGAGLGIALGNKKRGGSTMVPDSPGDISTSGGSPTSRGSTTTPNGPGITPAPTAFELELGYSTLKLTATLTSGDLCAYVSFPLTTTIYPSIYGNVEDDYTAYWTRSGYAGTLVATGSPPKSTDEYPSYVFDTTTSILTDSCSSNGEEELILFEDKSALYQSTFELTSYCSSGGYSFQPGESCAIYWVSVSS